MDDKAPFDQFVRTLDGAPSLLSVARTRREDRPDMTWVWQVVIPYESGSVGLPEPSDTKGLYRIEGRLMNLLGSLGGLYMGHIMGGGWLVVVFRGAQRAPESVTIKTGLIGRGTFNVTSREDRDWSWHCNEMQPTRVERASSRNRQLVQTLAAEGDKAEIVRNVDFSAFFPTEDAREAFIADVESHGYPPTARGRWVDDIGRAWCEIVHSTSIEEGRIAECCAFVDERAEARGGTYDGWATHVTTE
jgi:hypothetical protein